MGMVSKALAAVAIAGGLLSACASSAEAYAWSSTGQWATWNNGGYWVQNDIWGASPGNQTIYANSFSNWWVVCKYSGSGIKSYPATGKTTNRRVLSIGTLKGNFNATSPSGSVHDLAYDIWLDGSTYEVMVWQKWVGTKPIAGSYNSSGTAIATATNQSIGGITYNVYKRGNVMSFLRTGQVNSASGIDLKAVLVYCNNKRWYNNPTCANVQFGWEIINTGGVQRQFTMNSNSINFN